MDEYRKRKSEADSGGSITKKTKQWRVPKKCHTSYVAPTIEPGDAGIWATCDMRTEGKCTGELRDLFHEYAEKIYDGVPTTATNGTSDDNENENEDVDIEAEINKEVRSMKSKSTESKTLFQAVRLDIQCVLFFKTKSPVEPVSFVHRMCADALEGTVTKKHRFVKRLTPMTRMGKATEKGLEEVAKAVLEPFFHYSGIEPKKDSMPTRLHDESQKFAIRPTIRNHSTMKRDDIIKHIATAVGHPHSVDLKNYDLLILVDIYRNLLGMSVVGSDFEKLKRFNIAEIYDPTPPPKPAGNAKDLNANPEAGQEEGLKNTKWESDKTQQGVLHTSSELSRRNAETDFDPPSTFENGAK